MVIALVPLLFVIAVFKWYCVKTFDSEIDYFSKDAKHANESIGHEPSNQAVNRAAAKFRHPVLEKRLMTPMVPAKAKNIVAQIYSGRLNSEIDAGPGAFQDIPMTPVKQAGEPPQHQQFEAVPEAQEDYAFYKNRSDFGNVGGDRLSRYDMINNMSRPGTPSSFGGTTTKGFSSPYTSRPASPAPRSQTPTINRKEVAATPYQYTPERGLRTQHSRYSSLTQFESNDEGDISLNMRPAHGPYTDPDDDRANLLAGAGDLRTPNGEFMSLDQFRTPGAQGHYTQNDAPGSYDYFRGHGGLDRR